jgi:hypothetical protein
VTGSDIALESPTRVPQVSPQGSFVVKLLRSTLGFALTVLIATGCASARLEPADGAERVPAKPRAATMRSQGVQVIAETESWSAPSNVRDEVTALKVTIVNHGTEPLRVKYDGFSLVSDDGEAFKTVRPEDITIRGGSRSIGLPADAVITRSSDGSSGLNSPYRSEQEKAEIRQTLIDQSLANGELKPGERTTGFVYFQLVPGSKDLINLKGDLESSQTGKVVAQANIPFQVRKNP